jgi:hypothetical protein
MTDQEAVDLVQKIPDAQRASEILLGEALGRKTNDDVTILVVRFKDGTGATHPEGPDPGVQSDIHVRDFALERDDAPLAPTVVWLTMESHIRNYCLSSFLPVPGWTSRRLWDSGQVTKLTAAELEALKEYDERNPEQERPWIYCDEDSRHPSAKRQVTSMDKGRSDEPLGKSGRRHVAASDPSDGASEKEAVRGFRLYS